MQEQGTKNGTLVNDSGSKPVEISSAMMETVTVSLMADNHSINVDQMSINGFDSSKVKKNRV